MFKKWWAKLFPAALTPEPVEPPAPPRVARGVLSTHTFEVPQGWGVVNKLQGLAKLRPVPVSAPGTAMDSCDDCSGLSEDAYSDGQPNISDELANWYGSQSFIGHQLAAIIAQHWLVLKACIMPARDAIRHGFTVTTVDGDGLDPELARDLKRADKRYRLKQNMLEFISKGRIFGVRILIYKVDYGSPEANKAAYELPFNPDGVKLGSYRGMVQVDPYWCSPELDQDAASQPDTMHFYEPTWWQINGVRYHRTHLHIYKHGELADILKPSYLYGGIPVPQLIMERVYGAERTANEAPLLALTKRTMVYKTDTAKFLANFNAGAAKLAQLAKLWTNFGTRVIDSDDEVEQLDTSLADLDAAMMSQYQLVAAAAEVPATKLLQTSAKGFNATGEGDESNYHESLESIQEHDLTPMVEGHHLRLIRSLIPTQAGTVTTVSWEPLDSPTAKEYAETNKIKAETGAILVGSGAINGRQELQRVANDPSSDYTAINDGTEAAV